MVSPLVAQAILSQEAPDIVGSFRAGQQEARAAQARKLAGQALQQGGGSALEELQGLDPEIALAIGVELRSRSANDINDFIRDSKIGLGMLRNNDFNGALSFARQRRNTLAAQGRDTAQTDKLVGMLESGNFEGAKAGLEAFATSLDTAKKSSTQKAFAPITIVNDQTGEERIVTPTFDPNTGQASLANADIPAGFSVKSKRKTAEEAGNVKLSEEQAKQSTKLAGEAFNQLSAVRKGILNIDDAISAIDRGAKSGKIERFLPSIRNASIELDNIAGRMGLDVIAGTTFGALSESELAFALDTALPTGLNEVELREWLTRKRESQDKLRSELQKSATFLSKGGTVAELIEQQESLGGNNGAVQAEGQPEPQVPRIIEVDF